MFRIGHGYDAHRFVPEGKLILGGVVVPCDFGVIAHSDGDVILHAVCDALLGAAALGDIGQHFPDTDSSYSKMDSRIFLRDIVSKVTSKNYSINNVDITVLAQTPKLAPYIPTMRQNIAYDLRIDLDQVNVKATTTEKMGFIGRKEGIACYATTLIQQMSQV